MSVVEFLSQPLWQRLGLTLVHFLWQGLAVAVLAGAFVRVFRLKHGNARYGAYLLAFIAMIACPVVTFTAIDIPISPNTELVTGAESAEVVETFSYTALPAGDILPEAETSSPAMPTVADSIPLGQRISDWLNVSMPWVLVIWMVGVVVLSVRLLMGFVGVYRWRHHLEPLPERLVQRIASLSERLGMRGFSRVFISPTVLQAMAVGYLRPMVLLPAAMVTQMQPEMLEAVIAHELAHIRRFDLWINLAQRVTETLLFYHPAVWWLSNCIRRERELCCDELAVKATGRRLTYATTLESVGRAKVMAKQPVLAAGLGRDNKPTLGRVRHILGLKPTQRNCPFWLAGVITVLFLAALVIPTTLALTNRSDEKLNNFERVVVEGIRANRDKFECGYLAWSSKQFNDRDYKGHPAAELAGQYELWWDGKKMATKYLKDQVYRHSRDLEGRYWIEKQQGGNSYDGSLLSRKPRFRGDENWLGPSVTRWRGLGSRDGLIQIESNMENIRKDWSVIDANGVKLIRCMSKNMNETSQDHGAHSVSYYDPSKGYGMVNQESYNPNGSQRHKRTVKMLEVIPGGWFPVEVDSKSFAITDGRLCFHNHFALDIERCRFNDRAALPDRIFKSSIDKQLKYQEKLQKYLAMELEGISDVKEAGTADTVKRGAREAVEEFIAAALAGDFEKARQFADPDKAPYDQIEELPEVLKGQNLRIMAVVADDFDAIAVSSVIRGDHERIGPLVFFLDRKPQDGRDNWWVNDIDLETPDSAEGELKRFLEKHPQAKKVPYEHKANEQGKSQLIDVETLLNKVRQTQIPTENMIVEWQSERPQPLIVAARRSLKQDFSPPSRILQTYKAIIAGTKSRIEERELTFQSQKDTEPSRIREITYVFDGTMQKQLDHFVKGFENEYRGYRHTYDKNTQLLLKLLLAYPPYLDSPELQEKYNLKVIENKEKGLIILETSKENSGIHRYTIDPDKDYNIVKQEVILPRGTDYEINCIVKKQANGLWYQVAREQIRYSVKTGKPSLENKVKITKLDFNPEIPTGAFELQFPKGIKIWDGSLKDWVIVGDEEETSREPAVPVEIQEKEDQKELSKSKTTLANGVTVELVGICDHPSEGKQWWLPDGSLLGQSPVSNIDVGPSSIRRGEAAYVLVAKLTGPETLLRRSSTPEKWKVSQALKVGIGKYGTAKDKSGKPCLRVTTAIVKNGLEKIDIEFGLAGVWEKRLTISSNESSKQEIRDTGVVINPPYEKNSNATITIKIPNKIDSKMAINITAVLKNGKVIDRASRSRNSKFSFMRSTDNYEFHRINLSDVEHFEIYTSKYQWVTFKNVSLKSNFKTAVPVEGENESLIPKQAESSKEFFGITDALAVSDMSGHLTIKSIRVAGLDGKKLISNKASIFVDVVNSSDREVNLGLAYYTDSGTIAWFFSPGSSGWAKALKVRPNWQGQLEFPMNYSRFANGGYVKITLARCSNDHIEGVLLPQGVEVLHEKKYSVISVGQQKQVVRLLDTLRTAKGRQRYYAAEKLAKYGRSVVPAITVMLQDDNQWAAHALGLVGPEAEDAVPALIKSLRQGADGGVRGFSASALRQIGPAAIPAIPALIGALKDEHGNTRMHAAEALGFLSTGEKDVIEALTAALQDEDETVRKVADRSLKRIEDTFSTSTAEETDQAVAVPGDYIATLPNGVTVELAGICEHPSEGKQWWKPDGSLLKNSPYDDDYGRAFPKDGEKGYKFAVKYSGIAGRDIDARVEPLNFKTTNGGAFFSTSKKNGKENMKYLDGSLDEKIVWLGAAFDEELVNCDIRIGVCFGDWKHNYRYETDQSNDAVEWVTFKNVSLKPNFKTENNIQAPPLKDFERKLIEQVLDLVKQVEKKYPEQATHWPAGPGLYHVDAQGHVTVWHYQLLWQRSADCAEDEVGWGSSQLVKAKGMYYLPDGTPLQSRWRERGGGMKDIRVKVGRTVGKDERVPVIHRHSLPSDYDLLSRDGRKRIIEFFTLKKMPVAIIVRIDKPVRLDSWWLGEAARIHDYEDYNQLLAMAPPGGQQLMSFSFICPEDEDHMLDDTAKTSLQPGLKTDVQVEVEKTASNNSGGDSKRHQHVTFMKGMSIREALRFLGKAYKKNIILSDKVAGQVPVTELYNVTFEEALRAILGTHKYIIDGDFIRVYTEEEFESIRPEEKTNSQVEVEKPAVQVGFEETVSPKLVMLLGAINSCAADTELNIESISITARNISIKGDTSSRTNTLKFLDAIKKNELEVLQLRFAARDNRNQFSLGVKPKENWQKWWQRHKTDVHVGGEETISPKLVMLLGAINSCAAEIDLNIGSIAIAARDIEIKGDTASRTDTLKFLDAVKKNELEVLRLILDAKGNREKFSITAEPKKNWQQWWRQYISDVQVEGGAVGARSELVWGEAKNGLRAAVEFVPDKQQYSFGEKIELRFHIQNVSEKPIQLTSSDPVVSQAAIIEDDKGRQGLASENISLYFPIFERYHLQPGKKLVLKTDSLGITSKGNEVKSPQCRWMVRARPGVYFAQFVFRLSTKEPDYTQRQPRFDVPLRLPLRENDWKGTLETGKHELVVTPPLKPEGEAAVQVDRKKVWGEAVEGLRAAVEFVPEKESYSLGERVGVRFHIQNVSDHDIQIASTKWRQEDRMFVQDEQGKEISVSSGWFSGWARIVRYILIPRETVVLDGSGLGFGDAAKEQDINTQPLTNNFILCGPGRYFVHYKLKLPDLTRKDFDGKGTVPQPDDWQGVLDTGKRKLVLTSIAESDQKPAVPVEAEGIKTEIQEVVKGFWTAVIAKDWQAVNEYSEMDILKQRAGMLEHVLAQVGAERKRALSRGINISRIDEVYVEGKEAIAIGPANKERFQWYYLQKRADRWVIKLFDDAPPRLSVQDVFFKCRSVDKLVLMGERLSIYAAEHHGKLPDNLEALEPYIPDKMLRAWLREHVEYLGKGKEMEKIPNSTIAYTTTLVSKDENISALFNDGNVDFILTSQVERAK